MMIHEAMQEVERIMFDVVDSDVSILHDASRHILDAGGKRIRPRLVMLTYAALGGTDYRHAAPVAAAIELVHTASVVHDDINDHGVVRRGRPSVNVIWGRTFALLTGDYLFTKVYELMAPYNDLNVILAEATVALVEGETLQADAVKEGKFSRDVYYSIIARKTAALFRAAGRLGARLARGSDAMVEAMGQFGFNVGLAFQIIDDILDLTADAAQLGKTAGIDHGQGKGLAVAYDNGNGVALAEVTAVAPADPMVTLKQRLLYGDAIAQGRLHAQQLVEAAVATLDVLPPSSACQALADLARHVDDRDH
jgi:geranylgeranyl pyrophosphate synthase